METNATARIRALNDELRLKQNQGSIVVSRGIAALGDDFLVDALHALRSANDFTHENDPYGEHDFGVLTVAGQTLFWKIDYYDLDLRFASPDPADPDLCRRILTLMLAEEY